MSVVLGAWMNLMAAAPSLSPPPTPCTSAPYRQFDFWLGRWTVHGGLRGDQLQGSRHIQKVASGCAVLETWRSALGREGRSLSSYDLHTGRWRQYWTGGDGTVLQLEGGWMDGAMVLEGRLGAKHQRIRWRPLSADEVEQRWEVSDDGQTWTVQFLGFYRRPQPAPPPAPAADPT